MSAKVIVALIAGYLAIGWILGGSVEARYYRACPNAAHLHDSVVFFAGILWPFYVLNAIGYVIADGPSGGSCSQ